MHPLFTRGRLSLYLLAWVPFVATSIYVLATRGGLVWWQATAIAVPVFLFYAFLCLFAWYPCRATPLGRVTFMRLLLTHLIAAVFIRDRKSTRLNSSHGYISYAVFCLKKK